MNGLQQTYNNILSQGGQLLSNIGKGVSNVASGVGNFIQHNVQFNPIQNPMQAGFGPFQFKQPTIPQINVPQINTGNNVGNFVANLPGQIAQGMLNSPRQYQLGNQGLNQNLKDFTQGKQVRPQDVLANLGQTAELPLNMMGFGGAGEAATQIGKQGIKQLALQGAKQGALYGGAFGGISGLESGRNINKPYDYSANLASNTLTGIGAGALLGGGLGVLGGLPKSNADYKWMSAKNILATQTPDEVKMAGGLNLSPALQVLKNPNVASTMEGVVNVLDKNPYDTRVTNMVNGFFDQLLPKLKDLQPKDKAQVLDNLLSTANDNSFKPANLHPSLKPAYDMAFSKAGQEGRIGVRQPSDANVGLYDTKFTQSNAGMDIGNRGIGAYLGEGKMKWINYENLGESGQRLSQAYDKYNAAKGTGIENVSKARTELDNALHDTIVENNLQGYTKQGQASRVAQPPTGAEALPTKVKPVSLQDQYNTELTNGVKMPKPIQNGRGEPLPWESGKSAELQPKPIEPNAQLKTEKTVPQETQSSGKIISQKLKGGKYNFNEALASGAPKNIPEKPPLVSTPNMTLKDILSNRYAAGEQIAQRANILKSIQSQGIASGEHNLYRDVIQHPEDLQKALATVKNPDAFLKAVQAHKDFTDYIYNANKANGGTMPYRNNFATQIWDLSNPAKKAEYDSLVGKAKNYKSYTNKERVFQDIRQGNAAGFDLQNKTVQEDITQYANSMQKEISGRTFANQLKAAYPDQVHLTPTEGVPPSNAVQLKIPGMKGTYVSPQLYKQLSFLEPANFGAGAKIADMASGGLKHMELSGGLFHVKNTGMDYLGSHLAYGQMPRVDEAARSFLTEGYMNKVRQGWADSGQLDKMIKANVTLSKMQDFPSSVNQLSGVRGAISKVNPLSYLNRATFTRLEDYFKGSIFNILDKKGKIDFSTPEKTRETQAIGAQLNNIFGGQNRAVGDSVIKSKFGQWLGRQAVLAPDYQEGRFKRTLSAVNPNITGKAIGKLPARTEANNFALRTLAGRMIVTAVLAELSRRVVSGKFNDLKNVIQNDFIDPNYPTPFTNKNSKGQDVTQIAHMPASNASDMLKLAQDPEHFAISHLGAGLSAGLSYASNQDYFGNKLSNTNNPLEKVSNIVQSKLPIPAVQVGKIVTGKENAGNALINVAGDRVTQNPTDPIVMQNKLGSNAYDTAYQNALAAGKSDLSAQLAGVSAYNIVKKTGQSPFNANGVSTGQANGNVILGKNNKTIDLTPPTPGQGIYAFTNQNWKYSKANELQKAKDNGKITLEQYTQGLTNLGVSPQDAEYNNKASMSTDIKTQYIASKATTMPHNTLINELAKGRVVSDTGTQFASDTVLTNLYNQGVISQSEEKALKAIKVDKTGKSLNAGKVKAGKKLSIAKIKALKAPKIKLVKPKIAKVKAPRASAYTLKAPRLKIAALPRFGTSQPRVKKMKLSA